MKVSDILKEEFKLKDFQIENTIKLIDEGNTIPFIARYRKEMTGELSDTVLRNLYDRLVYLRNLESRKEDIQRLIEEQGKLTDKIKKSIEEAKTLQEAEDIYAPFKQKKRTRASIAKEKGLEKPALEVLYGKIPDVGKEAQKYINKEVGVESVDDVFKGINDIIAEIVSDDADVRKYLRNTVRERGKIVSKSSEEDAGVYQMYRDYSEAVKYIAPHRILAINRGEKEKVLKVKIEINDEPVKSWIERRFAKKLSGDSHKIVVDAIEDSYKRLIYPSIEREIRTELTEKAQERAIKVFGENLKSLLLQPPISGKTVMGFDPGIRTGCKIAVVDKNGKFLDYTVAYVTGSEKAQEKAKKDILDMIKKYSIDIVAIGNGTASRESEIFISDLIRENNLNVQYIIANEAGASVYSASELAAAEHPDVDVSIRGAISIGRRIQDPLAELIKIDPKSIGVGQYQHDLNAKRLEEVLDGVVEDAVNSVGADLNTASASLLEHVAGISKAVAKNIVAYREENGPFGDRKELKKVSKLGPKAYTQCAGFLRIPNAKNPLDSTGVHPESYSICEKMLADLGYTKDDIKNGNISDIDKKTDEKWIEKEAEILNTGAVTIKDIISEIKRPGRDPREDGIKPILRSDVLKIEDIKEGMVLKGTVRNVVDFGAFVDIGIKSDGLVHKSQMGKRVKDPMEVVSVGDIIDVKVLSVDIQKNRVSLSMEI
ncbi:RNA-binding transcriptional accessory protein [Peptacetobacter hominis]|uniref:RNA-binding transcriptional accessory protein n=1 Tax=Peptacetobacter hominis TaxID=2743610 RepID=A0A544QWU1_9FIRM|nr:Tex family protein [Peptacetobacter hominis]TQQ85143.1 RNA-binding transcriptional accessory protein [Peptacetobacter hominis]